MSLVYAGVCSHAPGITGRVDLVENTVLRDEFYANFDKMRQEIVDAGAEAIVVVAAEHFANFFMNNMPAFCVGMSDTYEGPIEDPEWIKIAHRDVPGNRDLSRRLIVEIMQTVDVAYAEEWKFDHGIMVPLHFLTPEYDLPVIPVNVNCQGPPLAPLHRAWAFGEALRLPCRKRLPLSARAASHTGRRHRIPEKSMRTGIATFWTGCCGTTKRRYWTTRMSKPTQMAGRVVSRFGHTSPLRPQRVRRARCISIPRNYRFLLWVVRSPNLICKAAAKPPTVDRQVWFLTGNAPSGSVQPPAGPPRAAVLCPR